MDAETYQCPGETYTISRSVHLGRLASFYPKCRECPHRHDTGGLARRVVRALETLPAPRTLEFGDQGVRGVYLNEMDRVTARNVAGSFGLFLRQQSARASGNSQETVRGGADRSPPRLSSGGRASRVVVARDEHPRSPDLAVGAIEGLRFAGCEVVDLGAASSPCLVFCIQHLGALGGMMVQGDESASSLIGLRLWREEGEPLDGAEMRAIQGMIPSAAQRPTRTASPYNTFGGSVPYLACLLKHFHALRPLKVAAVCASGVMEHYVQKLFGDLVCTRVRSESMPRADVLAGGRIGRERARGLVTRSRAHVGVLFEADGERATFFDEQGHEVEPESILRLLVRGASREHGPVPVVLEEGASEDLLQAIRRHGAQVELAPARPAAMIKAMRALGAQLGGGASGRIWFGDTTTTADALLALSGVLAALSWTDAPISQVLKQIG